MLPAAHALGLGAVWTGIFPLPGRVEAFRALFGMPETATPMALLVMGIRPSIPRPRTGSARSASIARSGEFRRVSRQDAASRETPGTRASSTDKERN
jgi:hypothetical protein